MPRTKIVTVIVLLLLIPPSDHARAQEWKTLLNLRGEWKIELGDNMKWAEPKFDDSRWDNIRVPSAWEDEGYPGYDGYAWYRKHFNPGKEVKDAVAVYVQVGYVDDVCEVYINGHMVGFEGQFPPKFITAYNVSRPYWVPKQYLNYEGDNVVAVRVYDQRLAGGITRGNVGLFEPREYLTPDLDLAGTWKFTTGDKESWKDPDASDGSWNNVVVPAYWETQGFKDYDGFGWYRLKFKVPENLAGERLILLAGRIDDFDETYLNGELIGHTGRMRKNIDPEDRGNEYTELRAYLIPSGLLVPGRTNVLAVRVLDLFMHGGMYDGPIGLITRDKYREWKRDTQDRWNPFKWFE
ncbi:MAG TPA: beta galactosidase jelly roll domain-containing protein [Bacteroidota bacterium]